jgi:hypothetical protein
LAATGPPCYDVAMRAFVCEGAFVCEVDHAGLRRLLPEDEVLENVRRHDEQVQLAPPTTLVWALLVNADAEDLRADVDAGRHAETCGLLLNRAVELISLGAAASGTVRAAR